MLFQVASPSFSAAKAPSPTDIVRETGAALEKLVKSFERPGTKQLLNPSLCFSHLMDSSLRRTVPPPKRVHKSES